jgi:hypothetical protein
VGTLTSLHLGLEQCTDKPIVLEEDESDDTGSETDLSAGRTARDACSFDSRQTILDRTISSAHSIPQGYDVEDNEAGGAGSTGASEAEMVYGENVRRPLKRKARDTPRQSPSKFPRLSWLFERLTLF